MGRNGDLDITVQILQGMYNEKHQMMKVLLVEPISSSFLLRHFLWGYLEYHTRIYVLHVGNRWIAQGVFANPTKIQS